LLKQRSRLPVDHPIVHKWPSGRFTGLLKDVDDVINGVWQSMLNMIDDLVTMLYLIMLCFANLAVSVGKQSDQAAYGVYVGLFLTLGISIMTMPFVWFYLFGSSVEECERMVREGQALYMSASQETLAAEETLCFTRSEENNDAERRINSDAVAVKSYWIYGRASFRAFFHRLAWETNYGVLTNAWTPLVAYFLLTKEGLGESFDTANIIIILLSLQDLVGLSTKLLQYLITMSRGCNVLRDVADILNANTEEYNPIEIDIEKGFLSDETTMSISVTKD
jgi:hypothetical protein